MPLSLTPLLGSAASSSSCAVCNAGPSSPAWPSSSAGTSAAGLSGERAPAPISCRGSSSAFVPRAHPSAEGVAGGATVIRRDSRSGGASAGVLAAYGGGGQPDGQGGASSVGPTRRASSGRLNKPKGYDRSAHLSTYYVCTACKWSGSTRARHDQRTKVKCKFTPCQLWYRAGEDRVAKVKDFLERCTATQRAHGLPPDGERVSSCGSDNRFFVTVPQGLMAGDTFATPVAANRPVIVVTVPEGAVAGQVVEVAIGREEASHARG